jgi:adenine-specific DNA-methyltransferase
MTIEELKRPERLDEDRIEAIKTLFPEAFPDGHFDAQTLRELLESPAEPPVEGGEFYGLNWPGKRQARKLAVKPSEGTLAPVPGEGVDEDTTGNVIIEGDNLEVMRTILKSYAGRVKLIYIDPPYNTGDDFVYRDNYAEGVDQYLEATKQRDVEGLLVSNPKTSGRYHSQWLSMMLARLKIAKTLLSDDGIIVVSIDDNERDNLKILMDEVYGLENFIGSVVWKSRKSEDSRAVTGLSTDHEYMLIYRQTEEGVLRGSEKDMSKFSNPDNDPRGPWRSADLTGLATIESRPNLHYTLVDPVTEIQFPPPEKGWRFERRTMEQKIAEGRILFPKVSSGRPRHKLFVNEMKSSFKNMSSVIVDFTTGDGTKETNQIVGSGVFDFPKPSLMIARIIEQTTEPGDIVMDFFAGSGTTGHAVLRLNAAGNGNRKFILTQLDVETNNNSTAKRAGFSTISEITREKLRKVSRLLKEVNAPADSLPDLGFRFLRLSRSNLRRWQPKTARDIHALDTLDFTGAGALVPDYRTRDVLTELMLLEGFPLDSRMEQSPEFDDEVHVVTHPERSYRLLVCLSTDTLSDATVEEAAKYPKDTFVCLESSLNDQLKIRLADAVENVKTL